MQRTVGPMMDYSAPSTLREVQEVTETVIDSPLTSYDRMGGPSNPSALYHDRRQQF